MQPAQIEPMASPSVQRHPILAGSSAACGWGYTIAWALSFYPQAILHFRRKSVVGLSYDYVSLFVTGVIFYAIYNNVFYFNPEVHAEWTTAYGPPIPVFLNDVLFVDHSLLITAVIVVQILIYQRDPSERVSLVTKVILGLVWGSLLLQVILCAAKAQSWLLLMQIMGLTRVMLTVVTVWPQIWKHFREKRTDGWSIGGIYLDIIGSLLSFLQQFIDSIAEQNWAVMFGSPAKTLLALVILGLDTTFMIQHYYLYPASALPAQSPVRSYAKLDDEENSTRNSTGDVDGDGGTEEENLA